MNFQDSTKIGGHCNTNVIAMGKNLQDSKPSLPLAPLQLHHTCHYQAAEWMAHILLAPTHNPRETEIWTQVLCESPAQLAEGESVSVP